MNLVLHFLQFPSLLQSPQIKKSKKFDHFWRKILIISNKQNITLNWFCVCDLRKWTSFCISVPWCPTNLLTVTLEIIIIHATSKNVTKEFQERAIFTQTAKVCPSPSKTGLDVYHLVLKARSFEYKMVQLIVSHTKSCFKIVDFKRLILRHLQKFFSDSLLTVEQTWANISSDNHYSKNIWYSSRDFIEKNKIILILRSRQVILIFVYSPGNWTNYSSLCT